MAIASKLSARQSGTAGVNAARIKGWCPGAHRPMMSGDGLVVRVRPFRGELSTAQAMALCDLAEEFGSGVLDLTSRANLQIRGVAEAAHSVLLERLDGLGLIDADPAIEGIRNILMPPTWRSGDLTDRLYTAVLNALPSLPDLPQKMGFAIDTAEAVYLGAGSADFRFELDRQGALILRPDGSSAGRPVPESDAIHALKEIAEWFVATGGAQAGRMARHLARQDLPSDWGQAVPRNDFVRTNVGSAELGTILGAPFGRMRTKDLRKVLKPPSVTAIRLMLDRKLYVVGADFLAAEGFVAEPSRLMDVHACPGAPFCPQATVETMQLAKDIASQTQMTLHVSGCAKGCAYPRQAEVTLVGRDGRFDLVRNGLPWDDASQRGLDPRKIREQTGLF